MDLNMAKLAHFNNEMNIKLLDSNYRCRAQLHFVLSLKTDVTI